MIMMGERLENKLFALALYIAIADRYVKSGWLIPTFSEDFLFIPADAPHT